MSDQFRWSSFCDNGECVEVAVADDDSTIVRDGKDPDGPRLTFSVDEWTAFLQGAKAGEFDV